MNMIELNVTGTLLEITDEDKSTSGSVNYDRCEFTFDSEWDGFTKTAVFSCGGCDSYRADITDGACRIPPACTEKEGILSIGVFGVDDNGTVIATNSVAHRIDEGTDSGEWIAEDESLVRNAIRDFEDYADRFAERLENRINTFIANVTNENDVSLRADAGKNIFPNEDYEAPEFTGAAALPSVSNGSEYDDFFAYKLDGIVENHPEYVTRRVIGTDASGEYPIYLYSFEPESYDKTLLITSTVHGSERIAFFALCSFLEDLCTRADSDPQLNYIRSKIKLAVVPVVNPYGLMHQRTVNSANVNIGCNFPFNWSACPNSSKGAEAADQAETGSIISLLDELDSDRLCAAIDIHTNVINAAGCTVFYPRFSQGCVCELADMINRFLSENGEGANRDRAVLMSSVNPTLTNYAADAYGISACELVWNNSVYGGTSSDENVGMFTEFIGRAVYTMAKECRRSRREPPAPFAKYYSWSSSQGDTYTVAASAEAQKMAVSAYSLSPNFPCLIRADGSVTLHVTSECTVTVAPLLYQVMSPELDEADIADSGRFAHRLTLGAGTHVIPVSSIIQAHYACWNSSSDSYCAEDVRFTLAFNASAANTVSVEAFSVLLYVQPSDCARPVEMSVPMGAAAYYSGDDIPIQTLAYPLGTYTITDGNFND